MRGASRRCRWHGASRGRPRHMSGPSGRCVASPTACADLADRAGRPVRVGTGARARLRRRDRRPGRRRAGRPRSGLDRHLSGRLPPRGRVRGPGGGGTASGRPWRPHRQGAGLERAAGAAPSGREDAVGAFAEPRFLHQTRELVDGRRGRGGRPRGALGGELPGDSEWRVHFHVPVHADGPRTTQTELSATLAALVGGPAGGHHSSRGGDLHLDGPARGAAPTRRRRPGAGARARAGLDARPAGGARPRGGDMTASPLLVLDVVGLTPRLLAHMPRLQALGQGRLPGQARDGAARRHLLGPVDVPDRAAPASTASSATAGTSASSARSSCGASTTGWCEGEKIWETARRGIARLHGRQPLLVVRHGRHDRHHRHTAPDLPRRRAQVSRLLHGAGLAPRRPHRRARARSRCSSTGGRLPGIASSEWIGARRRACHHPRGRT